MNVNNYNNLSSVWTHACDFTATKGKGSRLYNNKGESLLDFTSGIGVVNTGHCHPAVTNAIKEQAENLIFSQINCAAHNKVFELTEELKQIVPKELTRFFYAQSGAEAVEAAVKLSKHGNRKTKYNSFTW